ncbi:MAG: hypothetical protein U0836_04915 [Pirellulales bacterium]
MPATTTASGRREPADQTGVHALTRRIGQLTLGRSPIAVLATPNDASHHNGERPA